MKKLLIILVALVLTALIISCTNNVYIDKNIDKETAEEKKNIWCVDGVYFETANDAIDYVSNQTQSRSLTKKTEDKTRTIVLTRPVLAEKSDGITDESYEKYVEKESLRGNITVPSSFSGDLCIDFGGCRYDFRNDTEAFFVIDGGENIYIYNGTSVIFEDANIDPYAISVDTDIVTIDTHLIDDRRETKSLLYVGESGHLRVENVGEKEDGKTLEGTIALVTDGKTGAELDISSSDITIDNIYTMYKDESGEVSAEIADSITIDDKAKSRINIQSGNINIEKINKKSDYYNTSTSTPSIFDKAIINTIGTENDTTIKSAHDIHDTVEKAIEASTGTAEHIILHSLTHHPRVEATCIEKGNIEYWYCSSCCKYFSDKDAVTEIQEGTITIAVNPDAHSLEHNDAEAPTCISTGNKEYWHCTLCDKYFSDEGKTTTSKEAITIAENPNAHSLEHIKAKAATCTENGNIEYWHCTLCGTCFSDEGKTVITETVIPHHTISTEWEYDIDNHWHVCSKDGNKVYVEAHTWGEWQKYYVGGKLTHHYAVCSICDARKVASKPDYLVYKLEIGELVLDKIEDKPCGFFYINGEEVESGAEIYVKDPEVKAEYKPCLGSKTNYEAYTTLILNGEKELTGAKDSEGNYSVSVTLADKREHILRIQLRTDGGSLAFQCKLYWE